MAQARCFATEACQSNLGKDPLEACKSGEWIGSLGKAPVPPKPEMINPKEQGELALCW